MNLKEIVTTLVITVAACCFSASATAQGKATAVAATERIERLAIPSGSLKESVELIQSNLPKDHPPMNVIFGAEVETRRVPQLTLRNVTGSDALMLIAAAANIHVDPIRGSAGAVIGYRLTQTPVATVEAAAITADNSALAFQHKDSGLGVAGVSEFPVVERAYRPAQAGAASPGKSVNPFLSGGAGGPVPGRAGGVQSYGGGMMAGGSRPSPGGYGGMRGGDKLGSGGGFGDDAGGAFARPDDAKRTRDSGVQTQVYALAPITTHVKLEDVEETLQGLLKSEGISGNAAKLSFHPKTGVLVVRATDDIHRLVSNLLSALTQNYRETQENNATRQSTRLQIQLDAMARERERLEQRLEKAEALSRQYQNEIRRLEELNKK